MVVLARKIQKIVPLGIILWYYNEALCLTSWIGKCGKSICGIKSFWEFSFNKNYEKYIEKHYEMKQKSTQLEKKSKACGTDKSSWYFMQLILLLLFLTWWNSSSTS